MAEWISGLFSSAPSLARARPSGLIVMAVGVALAVFGSLRFRGEENRNKSLLTRLAGLTVAALGALLAMY